MLRLLFRLWWLQQRRSFTWKDAVVGGYLIFVYVMVGLGFYFGATLDGEELFEDGTPDALCAILVLTMLVPDIILKVVMKHDSTAMDDYLKSRPVPEKVWNRFLLLTNLANFSHACAHAPHAFLDAQRASGHCGLSADAGFLFHQWHLCHLLL